MTEICELCAKENYPVWFVDSQIWNQYHGGFNMLCPTCFMNLAESKGIEITAWELVPEKCERNPKTNTQPPFNQERDKTP